MILSIVIIAFALGLTYMHYLQGAFTSAISFACALGGALVAFGYYENVVNMMNQNGFADYAAPMSLLVLFSITYFALRVVADGAVPGNIALNLYVEKAGSVVFGFGAAVLAAGTFAVAMQMMPLGVSIAGFAPYATESGRQVRLPAALSGGQRDTDTSIVEELGDATTPADRQNLLLPADNLVLGLVKAASNGALSGSQSFGAIHPDLPVEAFMSRVGPDPSISHVILDNAKVKNVTVSGVYLINPPKSLDAEDKQLRKTPLAELKAGANQQLAVIRATFTDQAGEKDAVVRITPAAARLVIGDNTYYPIGTLEGSKYLALNRLDDLIPVPVKDATNSADFVYNVSSGDLNRLTKPSEGTGPVFVEFKMFGRVDLSDKAAQPYPGTDKTVRVIRKPTSPLGQATAKPTPH